LVEVAIERSDGNRFGSRNCSVVCIHKVHIGLRKIPQCAQQSCFVLDFNSREFKQVLQSSGNRTAIQLVKGLQQPGTFGEREIRHSKSNIASRGASK
jgi:hypothetical protein